jgi:hypothetical protein
MHLFCNCRLCYIYTKVSVYEEKETKGKKELGFLPIIISAELKLSHFSFLYLIACLVSPKNNFINMYLFNFLYSEIYMISVIKKKLFTTLENVKLINMFCITSYNKRKEKLLKFKVLVSEVFGCISHKASIYRRQCCLHGYIVHV